MDYLATFHTHYGALKFHQSLKNKEILSQMMPVPRNLSASCGVCVKFQTETSQVWLDQEDLDQVVECVENHGYRTIYKSP